MEAAIRFRELAARFELEAMAATLPSVRELKLKAAKRWEALANEKEMVVHSGGLSNLSDWIF